MSWHEAVRIEIEAEFLQFHSERSEHVLFSRHQSDQRRWADHGRWFKSTARGRLASLADQKRYRAKLARTVVRECLCPCGRLFALNKSRARQRQVTYCSQRCAVVTINARRARRWDGKTLMEWAALSGQPAKRLYDRLAAGWPVAVAVKP